MKLYLPRSRGGERLQEERGSSRDTPLAGLAEETVLVVEDDHALRRYTVESLKKLGYRVLEAANGEAALQVLVTGAEVDLLFTDVVMPGRLNGRALAIEAVRQRPHLKVLFTTGYTKNAIIHHGRLDADVHLISKPFTLAELGRKLREVLEDGR